MLSAVFIGMGFGCSQPATMDLIVDLVSLDERGMALSTYFLGCDSGISMGSFALGAVATRFGFGMGCMRGLRPVGIAWYPQDAAIDKDVNSRRIQSLKQSSSSSPADKFFFPIWLYSRTSWPP
jgi:hypothetical protein